MSETTYTGRCFCGAVEIEVHGEPVAMGYCHCQSCRHWSAGPVNAFTLWRPEAVHVTSGEAYLASYHKTPHSHRTWCSRCGGHLFTKHPGMELTDVYAAILTGFRFEPALHVHCGEAVIALRDALPRLRDLPREMGGSGVELAATRG